METCLKNPAVLNCNYFKGKKSTKFIFKQILNTVCGVFLKIDTRSHGLGKQSATPAPNQPYFKTVCEVV